MDGSVPRMFMRGACSGGGVIVAQTSPMRTEIRDILRGFTEMRCVDTAEGVLLQCDQDGLRERRWRSSSVV